MYPARNGESLSKTELNVPGGLLIIINCEEIKGNGIFEIIEHASCKAIFESKTTGVTATTELVANEHNPAILNTTSLLTESGTALTLPVRVRLGNPRPWRVSTRCLSACCSPLCTVSPDSGTRIELATTIHDYIEIWHNTRRRHGALNMLTPTEYENKHKINSIAA